MFTKHNKGQQMEQYFNIVEVNSIKSEIINTFEEVADKLNVPINEIKIVAKQMFDESFNIVKEIKEVKSS
jgi:hypothetical protein